MQGNLVSPISFGLQSFIPYDRVIHSFSLSLGPPTGPLTRPVDGFRRQEREVNLGGGESLPGFDDVVLEVFCGRKTTRTTTHQAVYILVSEKRWHR